VNVLPPIGLVAVVGGFWGWAWLQGRRFRKAVAEAAMRLGGSYTREGAASGGTLHGRVGDLPIVISFTVGTSRSPESTTVTAVLRQRRSHRLSLFGADAVARAPGLKPYSGLLARPELGADHTQLWIRVRGIVRNADRLVALAGLVAGLAEEGDPKPKTGGTSTAS
jgi:hypothetical protein